MTKRLTEESRQYVIRQRKKGVIPSQIAKDLGITAPLLHRMKTLNDIINDKTRLYAATLRNKKEFEYILKNLEKAIKKSKDEPLFYNNEKRSDDG